MPSRCSALGVLVVVAALACACQRVVPATEAVVRLGPAPILTCKPEPRFRWLDLVGNPYGAEFRRTFSYTNAEVVLRFPRVGPTFSGTLTARRLKPNFAYQIKLVGLPRVLWGERAEPASNRRIGEVGRWWRPGKEAGNAYFLDADKEKDDLEGYLLFGYFVTDAEGNASLTFAADSSYHVLWKTSQWPPAKEDARPTRHTVAVEAGGYGYDRSFPKGEVEIYAEAQYGRPPIGTARLEPGRYRCFFLLTEESFHAWGESDGGDWAAAMAAEIEFTITAPEKEPGSASPKPQTPSASPSSEPKPQ